MQNQACGIGLIYCKKVKLRVVRSSEGQADGWSRRLWSQVGVLRLDNGGGKKSRGAEGQETETQETGISNWLKD